MNDQLPKEITKYFGDPLSMAPWMELPKKTIPYPSPGFHSWIHSRTPTQPEPYLWLTFKDDSLDWQNAYRAGGKIGAYMACPIHDIRWPIILNYLILNLKYLVEKSAWNDIDQIDGNHRYVYTFRKSPSYEQLETIYNIYLHYFQRNHPDIKVVLASKR
jgi:hypothetical protein